MKAIIIFFLLLAIIYSCQQTELEFSCSPVINEFILENTEELSQLSLNEIVTYEISLQKAIFRSWTPEKKRTVWLKKLHYVLDNHSLEKEEKDHIQKLIEHITVDYFSDENISMSNASRYKFAEEWLSYASNNLKWTKQFIAFLVYRLYTSESQFDAESSTIETLNNSILTNSESSYCNCNTSSDFCPYSDCRSAGCTTSSGCGWLWSEPCNGNC